MAGCSIGVELTTIELVLFLTFYAKREKKPRLHPWSSSSKVDKFLNKYSYEIPTRYTHSQLYNIINNFPEKLGEGGYGVVYK